MTNENIDVNKGNGTICPFLGFSDDPETSLTYPSTHNYCHHAKPISKISLSQQRFHCLNGKFAACPVYLNKNIEALPKDLRVHDKGAKPWLPIVLLVIVLLIGFISSVIFGIVQIPGFAHLSIIKTITPNPTIFRPSSTVEIPVTSSDPPLDIIPTRTIIVPTPTEIIHHSLETPFGDSPQLVIHRLVEGDWLIVLAKKYNTTVEAIKAINYNMPPTLLVKSILVVPINESDVNGVPQFSVYEVGTDGTTVEELAELLTINVQLLKKYNSFPDRYILEKGEWLVVPHEINPN